MHHKTLPSELIMEGFLHRARPPFDYYWIDVDERHFGVVIYRHPDMGLALVVDHTVYRYRTADELWSNLVAALYGQH